MPGVEGLPEQWQGIATLIFVIAAALFAAWASVFGKKHGSEKPKVQEFYASGQFADMGPVKELVESVGLVMQQMVRTNLQLEETAKGLKRLGDLLEQRMEEERRDREIAEEVRRQLKDRG